MVIKVVCGILAVILTVVIGYTVVKTVIQLFAGEPLGDAIGHALDDIVHLFGIIKQKTGANIELPMANQHITWNTARSW